VSELAAEDAKLLTLARSAKARTRAAQGAAVRDTDGRTYVATTVSLPSLTLSALQLAVAMAVSSGALGLEAGLVLVDALPDADGGADVVDAAGVDAAGVAALRDLAPEAALFVADMAGSVTAR
jgi:hypothetical protein